MYHTFFYGPFADEAAVIDAIRALDLADPFWDYDCFAISRGDPNCTDYSKLPYVTQEERERIEAARERPPAPLIREAPHLARETVDETNARYRREEDEEYDRRNASDRPR